MIFHNVGVIIDQFNFAAASHTQTQVTSCQLLDQSPMLRDTSIKYNYQNKTVSNATTSN